MKNKIYSLAIFNFGSWMSLRLGLLLGRIKMSSLVHQPVSKKHSRNFLLASYDNLLHNSSPLIFQTTSTMACKST